MDYYDIAMQDYQSSGQQIKITLIVTNDALIDYIPEPVELDNVTFNDPLSIVDLKLKQRCTNEFGYEVSLKDGTGSNSALSETSWYIINANTAEEIGTFATSSSTSGVISHTVTEATNILGKQIKVVDEGLPKQTNCIISDFSRSWWRKNCVRGSKSISTVFWHGLKRFVIGTKFL